jgi:hypothetical protein
MCHSLSSFPCCYLYYLALLLIAGPPACVVHSFTNQEAGHPGYAPECQDIMIDNCSCYKGLPQGRAVAGKQWKAKDTGKIAAVDLIGLRDKRGVVERDSRGEVG